jgi:hypothetical protein
MSLSNSHPAKTTKLKSLGDDLAPIAKRLIEQKFKKESTEAEEGEVMKTAATGPPIMYFPRVEKSMDRLAYDIFCGRCGFRIRSIDMRSSMQMQQQRYISMQGLGTSAGVLGQMAAPQVQAEFFQSQCPHCQSMNQGKVYLT